MEIDRRRPPFRDDPVIAALTDEQAQALFAVLGRFLVTAARRRARERDDADERADPTEVA